MYLQYNIFTGLSASVFGVQPLSEYLEFFTWRGGRYGINIPISLALSLLALAGIGRGLQKRAPWAIGLLFYSVGHALVPHKESRFMLSIFTILLWASVEGYIQVGQSRWAVDFSRRLKGYFRTTYRRRLIYTIGVTFLFTNTLLTTRALWGEIWTSASTYFDVSTYLRDHPKTCAILTPRTLGSILLPSAVTAPIIHPSESPGAIVMGWETMGDRRARFFLGDPPTASVQWYHQAPHCESDQNILLQLNFPETAAEQVGCNLLGSGVLAYMPKNQWPRMIEKNYARGVWYSCPRSLLEQLGSTRVVFPLARRLGHYEHLPRFGITGSELLDQAREVLPPPPGYEFITYRH